VSLRNRVTLGTVLVLGAGLVLISVALNLLLVGRLSADASAVLANRAAAMAATVDTHGGRLRLREAPDDQALDQHAWVFDAAGRTLARSPASGRLARAVGALAHVRRPTETNPTEHIRLFARPIGRPGAGVVVVGVSMDPYRHTERLAVAGTFVLDVFVLLAGALVARRAVGLALRPVADMTATAADWSEHDLHRRFGLGPPRDELTALAATLDALLGRIDAALRHEQRFSAEMAHELRTPLSTVRGEAELALRAGRSDAERRAALEAVLAGTDRMATVIDTLLAAARSDAARGSADAVAAARAVERLVRPEAEAHRRRLVVRAEAEPLPVGAGEDVVTGALHPLLENAVRHAAAAVEIDVGRDDGQVVIAVRDDGAGIAPADAERIFEPGVSAAGGAGLGLPLARRLARAAGGDVVAVPQDGGRVELRLPALSA
jgi:signal transduction histidine kinase